MGIKNSESKHMQQESDNKSFFKKITKFIKQHPVISLIILLALFLGSLMSGSGEESQNNSATKTAKSKSISSSSEDTSSTSSETESSSSQVNESDSIKELKAVVSTPMTKKNFLNIEQGVLDSAQYNDIDSPNQSEATQFKSRVSNIDTLISNNNNLADSESEHLTDNDFNTLKSYQTKLIDYLNALHDYATTYQTDNPVIQKADTPEDTKTEFQDELNESKQTFETAKNDWLTAYDSIMNQ
ncbi:hypothetical protein [Leuconostoc mesenteroides]|uniref:hypothetical protein n=1 Tax=Leuconostoc mesenteroides TaxID=1245 RepID=UPI0023613C09|nr:hypothetical protein [Leuconostoc mesenteroides]